MENQPTDFEKIEAKIDRIENRISGMRTEFRGLLSAIRGEVEEVGIQMGIGQQQMQRLIRSIFFAACGAGVAVIGVKLVSRFLDGGNQSRTESE